MPLPCSIVVNGTRVIEICVVEVLHSEPRANRAKSGAANLATVLTLLWKCKFLLRPILLYTKTPLANIKVQS